MNSLKRDELTKSSWYYNGFICCTLKDNYDVILTIKLPYDLIKHHNMISIDYICKKAYFSLNSIFRCITTKFPIALLNAYNIYCRPILEYASIIWSPFSKVSKFRSLIDQIERVQ